MKKTFSTLFLVFGLSLIFSANAFADLYTFRAGNCPVVELSFYQYDKRDGTLDRGYGHPLKKNGRVMKIPPHRTQQVAFNLSNDPLYDYRLIYKYNTYHRTIYGYDKIATYEREIVLDKNKKIYYLGCDGGHRLVKPISDRFRNGWRKIKSNHHIKKIKSKFNDWRSEYVN